MGFFFRTGIARLLRAGRWAAIACLLVAGPGAAAAQGAARTPSFSTHPALHPSFKWWVRDYAVRCDQNPLRVRVKNRPGWRAQVGPRGARTGSFVVRRSPGAGDALVVSFYRIGNPSSRTYFHLRCLPQNFPPYQFKRTAPGGPDFFATQLNRGYAVIFNGQGVPMWWYPTGGQAINAQVLRNGMVSWDPANAGPSLTGAFEVRRLDGSLVRRVNTVGGPTTDIHDLSLLGNGHYLLAGQVIKSHVDTSAYGGSADADVMGFEVQEVTPGGKVVWKWDSFDHIGFDETPTVYWNQVVNQPGPYDIQHYNSLEPEGNWGKPNAKKRILVSFRNLDAVYEINRATGNIVWKLGGTATPKSLTVLNDPYASYPLGGQHDARRLADGTITVHDNFSNQNRGPRAVRYSINAEQGTATLVESRSDADAQASQCCGSARRLPSGDWLIGWGRIPTDGALNRFIGGYNSSGQRIFQLSLPYGFFYRAIPVPPGWITAQKLRRGMNAMAN
jgi:Arylsulfotransferase (ASST)